jgi:hypothetical protein
MPHRHTSECRADLKGLFKGVALGIFVGGLVALPLSSAIFFFLF